MLQILALILAVTLSLPAAAASVNVNETVKVKPIPPPAVTLSGVYTPLNPTIVCNLAPGTVVSTLKVTVSDGSAYNGTVGNTAGAPNTVVLVAGSSLFSLTGSGSTFNVVVSPTGTALADLCPTLPALGTDKAVSVTVTN